MALITRMSRLFAADLHAVLDRMEEPEILLKQGIREMEVAVAAAEHELAALRRQSAHVEAARSDAGAQLAATQNELDVCLDADNDTLARSVIRRRLQLQRTLAELTAAFERLQRTIEERQRAATRNREELEALRSKASVFETAAHHEPAAAAPCAGVSPEEVEVALLHAKQQRARS